jgi:hypothetical protein
MISLADYNTPFNSAVWTAGTIESCLPVMGVEGLRIHRFVCRNKCVDDRSLGPLTGQQLLPCHVRILERDIHALAR